MPSGRYRNHVLFGNTCIDKPGLHGLLQWFQGHKSKITLKKYHMVFYQI